MGGVVPYVVGAGTQILGGVLGGNAAKKAAEQQARAAQQARAFLQDIYSGAQQRYSPYQGAGMAGLVGMGGMLGSALPQSRSALGNVAQNYGPPPQLQGFSMQDLLRWGASQNTPQNAMRTGPRLTQTQADAVPPSSYANPGDNPEDVQWIRAWETAHPGAAFGERRLAMEQHFRPDDPRTQLLERQANTLWGSAARRFPVPPTTPPTTTPPPINTSTSRLPGESMSEYILRIQALKGGRR